jgi:hypothetical protein
MKRLRHERGPEGLSRTIPKVALSVQGLREPSPGGAADVERAAAFSVYSFDARCRMAGAAHEETDVTRFDRRESKLVAGDTPVADTPAGSWPVDLVPDVFLSAAPPPWLPEGELAAGPCAVGDSVRLVRLPPMLAGLPRRARKRFGAVVGQLFEVVALTIPGQVAIARWVEIDGESGMQTLYVPVDCVERVDFESPATRAVAQ